MPIRSWERRWDRWKKEQREPLFSVQRSGSALGTEIPNAKGPNPKKIQISRFQICPFGVRQDLGLRISLAFEFWGLGFLHRAIGTPRSGIPHVSRHFRELSVFGALLLVLVILAIAAPGFYQPQPLLSLATREAPTLVVACGMALVIICRQIDISVGSQFAVCSVCAGLLAAENWPTALIAVAAVAVGAMLGMINGALIAGMRLPSIVVTLATMVTWGEALRWQRQGAFVNLPDRLQWLGMSQTAGQWVLVCLAVLLLIMMALAMRHVAAGRFVYAVGTDAEAARLAGIRPQWVTFNTFVLLGALTGVAAMMNVAQSPQVDPKSGTGLELKAIAAVVVGGVAISGGRGSLWGVFGGLLLLACVAPALTHLHVQAYWEKAIQGAIILLAVVADGVRSRKLH
jgi:rhamnose transport system permease protein